MPDLVPTYRLAVDELGAASLVAIKFFPAGYGREHLDRYEFPWQVWSTEFQSLTRAKIAGELPKMQLSVPSAWEFYLPLIEAGIDLTVAEAAWRYRSPLREAGYSRLRSLGDVAGVTELCVSGDGTVYPSVLMVGDERMHCGSLREQSLSEIWHEASPLVRIRGLSVDDLDGGCSSCAMNSLCGGGSRSRALAEHGSIDAADSSCPLVSTGVAEARAVR
ncbi:SPASM domain-containing protein [Gandjariella thermophila]|nr:SPASM domain-containing protein [Gandjariella thermophila]